MMVHEFVTSLLLFGIRIRIFRVGMAAEHPQLHPENDLTIQSIIGSIRVSDVEIFDVENL
jgi:hypothetical protein